MSENSTAAPNAAPQWVVDAALRKAAKTAEKLARENCSRFPVFAAGADRAAEYIRALIGRPLEE